MELISHGVTLFFSKTSICNTNKTQLKPWQLQALPVSCASGRVTPYSCHK